MGDLVEFESQDYDREGTPISINPRYVVAVVPQRVRAETTEEFNQWDDDRYEAGFKNSRAYTTPKYKTWLKAHPQPEQFSGTPVSTKCTIETAGNGDSHEVAGSFAEVMAKLNGA